MKQSCRHFQPVMFPAGYLVASVSAPNMPPEVVFKTTADDSSWKALTTDVQHDIRRESLQEHLSAVQISRRQVWAAPFFPTVLANSLGL